MKIASTFVLAVAAAGTAGCSATVPTVNLSASLSPLEAIVAREAREQGVPFAIANAVVTIESRYNPQVTGAAGEVGLMQIKYETARSVGYEGSRAGLYDPETNIEYGMKYLAAAYEAGGGTVCGTMFKYQAGLYATRQSDSTRQYCERAQAIIAAG